MTVVCSVAAKPVIHSSIYGYAEEIQLEGTISIKRISDVDNLCQCDFVNETALSNKIADLDNLELLGNGNMIRLNFGSPVAADYRTFVIENSMEYELFKDAVAECRMLSEMTLRLSSLTRDIYFAGIYSSHLGETKDLLLCEALQTMGSQQIDPSPFSIFQLFDTQSLKSTNDRCDSHLSQNVSSTSGNIRQHPISEINCVFCGVQQTMEISREFAIHPYVPLTFSKKNIYMCVICLHNWKDFREKAILDNQLVLKNEVNEELCGICSDTPAELIMCSQCPRSFCNVCLIRVLSSGEIKELDNLNDWICMSCKQNITSAPPHLDSRQWCIVKPTINNYRHKSNLFSSKATSMRLKAPLKNETVGNETNCQKNEKKQNLSISVKSTPAPLLERFKTAEPMYRNIVNRKHDEKTIKTDRLSKSPDSPIFKRLDGGLPYLDDFDDGSSTESVCDKIIDDDDDCNLIITLPPKYCPDKNYLQLKLPGKPKQILKRVKKRNVMKSDENKIIHDNNYASQDDMKIKKNNPFKENNLKISAYNGIETVGVKRPKNALKEKILLGSQSGIKEVCDPTGSCLPPVNTAVDEVYYFAQYVQYYDTLCESAEKITRKIPATDDVCFLCKDGGDLIECDDSKHKLCDKRKRCKKVYHSYCLSYIVEDDGRDWRCPRHFCDACGSSALKYICKYCPLSICKSCPQAMAKKYGLSRYKAIKTPKTGEFSDRIHTIVCQSCLDMYRRCIERGEDYCGFSSYTTNIMNSSQELSFLKGYNVNANSFDSKIDQENTNENVIQVRTSNEFPMTENANGNGNEAEDNFLHHSDFGVNDDVLLFNFTPESPNVLADDTLLISNEEDEEENFVGCADGSDVVDESYSKSNTNSYRTDNSSNNDSNDNITNNINNNNNNDSDDNDIIISSSINNNSSSSSVNNNNNNSNSSSSSNSSSDVNNDMSSIRTNVLTTSMGTRTKRILTGKRSSSPMQKISKNSRAIEDDFVGNDPHLSVDITETEEHPAMVKYDIEEEDSASVTTALIITASIGESVQNSITISINTSDIQNDKIESHEERIENSLLKKRGRPYKIPHSKGDSKVRSQDFNKNRSELDTLEGAQNYHDEEKMIHNTDDFSNNKGEEGRLVIRNDDSDLVLKSSLEMRGSIKLGLVATSTVAMPPKSTPTSTSTKGGEFSSNPTSNNRRQNDQENKHPGECSIAPSNTNNILLPLPPQPLFTESDSTPSCVIGTTPAASLAVSADIPSTSVAISHPVPASAPVSSPSDLLPCGKQKGRPKKKDRRLEDKVDSIQFEEISPSSVTSTRKRHSERLSLGDIDASTPAQTSLSIGILPHTDEQRNDGDHLNFNNHAESQSVDMNQSLPLSLNSTKDYDGALEIVENLSLQSTTSTIDT